jgi:hypothetical protein
MEETEKSKRGLPYDLDVSLLDVYPKVEISI